MRGTMENEMRFSRFMILISIKIQYVCKARFYFASTLDYIAKQKRKATYSRIALQLEFGCRKTSSFGNVKQNNKSFLSEAKGFRR